MKTLIHVALIAGMIAAPVTPLAAAPQTGEAKLARLTSGRTAGKPIDCINTGPSTNDSEKLPKIGIAYRQGSTWYVSRFEGGCPQLSDDTIVVTRLHSSQLCRGDIAELRMAGPMMPEGSCVFGAFTPYTRP